MKTLHITNAWHASSGGIATFYRALIAAANDAGHQIRLVVPGDEDGEESCGRFAKIYRIRAPRAPLNPAYRMLFPHRFLFPRTAIQRILNAEKPDLVEICEKYTLPYLAGLLRTQRLPGVNHRPTTIGLSCERMDENMAAYLSGSEACRSFCERYMKWIYFPMFDHHIAVSEHVAGELIAASRGHKVRRGVWIGRMGVDAACFHPRRRSDEGRARLRQAANAPEHSSILIYAGRLAPEKNLSLLIDTMAELANGNFVLAVAGDGMMQESLRRDCLRRNIRNVRFLGHIPDRELLAEYYANADVFIHPNPREPFGIAPLEAMASGVALVGPDRGGVTSYATPDNAWLAPPEAFAFGEAVRRAVADPDRERRTRAARRVAEEHSWPAVAGRFLDLYRELHELTEGRTQTISFPARTYSTTGDVFGRETHSAVGNS